jgi:ABC-2 type transport system permease protein
MALVTVNGIESTQMLPSFETVLQGDVFIKVGFTQELFEISRYCSVAALVFGLMTIAGDRRRTLNILLTKPISKKEAVTGKFLGIITFMLLLIVLTFTIISVLTTLAFRGPLSMEEFVLRVSVMALALLAECSLLAGIGMLIGIIFDSLKEAIMVGTMFLCAIWYTNGMSTNALTLLSPQYLYFKILLINDNVAVFDTTVPFGSWLSLAWPYISLMIIAILAVFAVNCYAIAKKEDC